MKIRFSLIATLVAAIILCYALYRKGDVKANFKTPLIEFTLDAKDKPPLK
jgi:hypothetical protein